MSSSAHLLKEDLGLNVDEGLLELQDDTKLGSQQLDSQTGVQIDTRPREQRYHKGVFITDGELEPMWQQDTPVHDSDRGEVSSAGKKNYC